MIYRYMLLVKCYLKRHGLVAYHMVQAEDDG